MNKADLAQKIKIARKKAGLSQEELAGRSHIAPRALQRIEAGKGNPTLDTLISIMKVLQFDLFSPTSPRQDFDHAADFLMKYTGLTPFLKSAIYALVYKNPDLFDIYGVPEQVVKSVRHTIKGLLKIAG